MRRTVDPARDVPLRGATELSGDAGGPVDHACMTLEADDRGRLSDDVRAT